MLVLIRLNRYLFCGSLRWYYFDPEATTYRKDPVRDRSLRWSTEIRKGNMIRPKSAKNGVMLLSDFTYVKYAGGFCQRVSVK